MVTGIGVGKPQEREIGRDVYGARGTVRAAGVHRCDRRWKHLFGNMGWLRTRRPDSVVCLPAVNIHRQSGGYLLAPRKCGDED